MRRRVLLALAVLGGGCTARTELAVLPDGIEWAIVVRGEPDGTTTTSPLLPVEDGALTLAVEGEQTLDVWAYGAELAPLLAGISTSSLAEGRMREAAPCETTLPAARWSAHVSAARGLSEVAPARTWTASWLDDACPHLDSSTLRASVECAIQSCGTVRVHGCALDVDLDGCGHGHLLGRVGRQGELCLIPRAAADVGTCTTPAALPVGAAAALSCDLASVERCEVNLYVSPETTSFDLDVVRVAEPAPEGVGPDANDFGVQEHTLRRMRAIPWTDEELLVTWWPWNDTRACREAERATPTRWTLVNTLHGTEADTGTTSPCVSELVRVGPQEALALAVVAEDAWALTRLGTRAAEVQRVRIDAQVEALGPPRALRLTDAGEPVVMFAQGELRNGSHAFVRYDPRTLEPTWTSRVFVGFPTFALMEGDFVWSGNASTKAIERVEIGTGAYTERYLIPDLFREPTELGGLLLPDVARGTEVMAVLMRDMPGLLVAAAGTTRLAWYAPFQRDDAYPTTLSWYRGAPIVTLLSRDAQRRFRADLVTIDPHARRWLPGVTPLALRVVSEVVVDATGRTWVIAPWDGVVARLP